MTIYTRKRLELGTKKRSLAQDKVTVPGQQDISVYPDIFDHEVPLVVKGITLMKQLEGIQVLKIVQFYSKMEFDQSMPNCI